MDMRNFRLTEDKGGLFDNIGNKIKTLAVLAFVLGAIVSVGIAIMFGVIIENVFLGIVIGVVGLVFSYLSIMVLYGFGELIEKTAKNERNTRELCEMYNKNTENGKAHAQAQSQGKGKGKGKYNASDKHTVLRPSNPPKTTQTQATLNEYSVSEVAERLFAFSQSTDSTVWEVESDIIDQWTVEINEALVARTDEFLDGGVLQMWCTDDESYVFFFESAVDAHRAMRYLQASSNDMPYRAWTVDCERNIVVAGEKETVELIMPAIRAKD